MLVLDKFQRWFLLNFVVYTALFLVILDVGLFFWFKIVVDEVMSVGGLLSSTFISVLKNNQQQGVLIIIFLSLSLLAIAAFQSFLFSRRIAGPIYALAKHLDKCEENGKIEKINLRKNDLFVDLAEKFNSLAESINGVQGKK